MSFDLTSWLWWRLLSVVLVIVVWLLLAFGVRAVPLGVRQAPAAHFGFEAAGRLLAREPGEGRLDWTARRFDAAVPRNIAEGQM